MVVETVYKTMIYEDACANHLFCPGDICKLHPKCIQQCSASENMSANS